MLPEVEYVKDAQRYKNEARVRDCAKGRRSVQANQGQNPWVSKSLGDKTRDFRFVKESIADLGLIPKAQNQAKDSMLSSMLRVYNHRLEMFQEMGRDFVHLYKYPCVLM